MACPDAQPMVVRAECPSDPVIRRQAASLNELKTKNTYTVLFVPAYERPSNLAARSKAALTAMVIRFRNLADRHACLWLAHGFGYRLRGAGLILSHYSKSRRWGGRL